MNIIKYGSVFACMLLICGCAQRIGGAADNDIYVLTFLDAKFVQFYVNGEMVKSPKDNHSRFININNLMMSGRVLKLTLEMQEKSNIFGQYAFGVAKINALDGSEQSLFSYVIKLPIEKKLIQSWEIKK